MYGGTPGSPARVARTRSRAYCVDVLGHRHPPHDLLQVDDRLPVQQPGEVRPVLAGRLLHDLDLVLRRGVLHVGHEHEAVELRLGQRVGAFLLDRVLRRQHEERLGQLVGVLAAGDAVLLHRFQQGGLRLGRRAVDLVGQHHVGKQRALHEPERALAGGVVFFQHGGAGDVAGHQVGRELHALERQVQHVGDGLDQQRLGQPGHADQQHVALAEHGGQHLLDDFLLPDDDLAQLVGHHLVGAGKLLDGLQVGAGALRGDVLLCHFRNLRLNSGLTVVRRGRWRVERLF